jgi:hypothetical protein
LAQGGDRLTWIQGTRPQTLSFGLTDSPAGLAAWIVEKFRRWSDCNGDVESVFTRDKLLANISFYWFTGAIGSSFFPYYYRLHRPWMIPEGGTVTAPTGYAEFPREMLRPPRSLAEKMFTDIRRWTDAEGRAFRRDGAAGGARRGGSGVLPPVQEIGRAPQLILPPIDRSRGDCRDAALGA